MSDDTTPSAGFSMDRELQRKLLERMRDIYPNRLKDYPTKQRYMPYNVAQAIYYLREHELIEGRVSATLDRDGIKIEWGGGLRITAAGLDFLADDGGITAILRVFTVKLHADTIRDLLVAKVDAAENLAPEKKAGIKAALTKLPSAALQTVTGDLVKMGLEHAPNAVSWIERLVHGWL